MTPPGASTTPPHNLLPYGLYNAADLYASSVTTNMSAYEDLQGHHLRSTLDLVASATASEYPDSTETPGPELRTFTAHRQRLENERCSWDPCYYYFGYPDSDSADDSYDLTRECFHIDGAVASDSESEAIAAGRANATPPCDAHLAAHDGVQIPEKG